ncbi:MAG: hypothetical protein LBQ38_00675 [Spirochaetaceae bacterium]|jgi:hypothetical protein|nr:hypothetical protein [Spirochaetaceae bacterium]
MMKGILSICLLIIAVGFSGTVFLAAQTNPEAPVEAPPGLTGPEEGSGGNGEEGSLPRRFRNISLGMGLEALKEALRTDELFRFRGDRDVSLLPSREQSLIETTGFSFIRRAFFQLREGELYIMAFSLNPALIDHYSVYTGFVKKYGEPLSIDPKQAVWETGDTRVAIERPLTVKYIDRRVFNAIIAESGTAESGELLLREEFLDGF